MPIDNRERVEIPNKVPPGVPGAGWVVGILVVFCAIMLTADIEEWSLPFVGRHIASPSAPSHHTTSGAGARGPS